MKAFEMLRTLKGREKKEFDSVIKTQSRKTLQHLYNEMKKHLGQEDPPCKELLFRKTFERDYDTASDYLLRNELRLLAAEVEKYIVQVEFRDRCTTNPSFYKSFLLRAWKRRNLHNLLALNIEEWIEEAMYNWQYRAAHSLIGYQLTRTADMEIENTDKVRKIAYYSALKKEALLREFMQEYRYCEEWEALMAFTAGGAGAEPIVPAEMLRLDDDTIGNAWSKFFRLHTLGYSQNIEEQLQSMLVSLEELNTIEARGMFGHDGFSNYDLGMLKSVTLERLGTLCMLLDRCDEGIRFFEENIAYCLAGKIELLEVSYYNLLFACACNARYSDAVQFYEANRGVFERDFAKKYASVIVKAACHLFLCEPEKAVQCIPVELRTLSSEHNIEFRLVQAVAFYQYGRVEDSCREMLNLERMIRNRDFRKAFDSEVDYHRLVDLYHRFFKAQAMLVEKKKETLGELKRDIEAFRSELAPVFRRHYFLSWIVQQLP